MQKEEEQEEEEEEEELKELEQAYTCGTWSGAVHGLATDHNYYNYIMMCTVTIIIHYTWSGG